MKVFTNTTFTGHWPVGAAAVVIADTRGEAAVWLEEELRKQGLEQSVHSKDMIELKTNKHAVKILTDGNY